MKLSRLLESVHQIRLLTESGGELGMALRDFATSVGSEIKWALGGGLAAGFHARPRGTQDVDIFVQSENEVEKLKSICTRPKFAWGRQHAITHLYTGAEIEILSPEFLKRNPIVIKRAIETAEIHDGIPVVSKEGLIALKLQRAEHKDLGDIEEILQKHGEVDLSGFDLTNEQIRIYQSLKRLD